MENDGFIRQPLPASFLLVGLLGFIISFVFIYSGRFSLTWNLLIMLISVIFVVASLKSIKLSATSKHRVVRKEMAKHHVAKKKKVAKKRSAKKLVKKKVTKKKVVKRKSAPKKKVTKTKSRKRKR